MTDDYKREREIQPLGDATMWTKIKEFFSNLFGSKKIDDAPKPSPVAETPVNESERGSITVNSEYETLKINYDALLKENEELRQWKAQVNALQMNAHERSYLKVSTERDALKAECEKLAKLFEQCLDEVEGCHDCLNMGSGLGDIARSALMDYAAFKEQMK